MRLEFFRQLKVSNKCYNIITWYKIFHAWHNFWRQLLYESRFCDAGHI